MGLVLVLVALLALLVVARWIQDRYIVRRSPQLSVQCFTRLRNMGTFSVLSVCRSWTT